MKRPAKKSSKKTVRRNDPNAQAQRTARRTGKRAYQTARTGAPQAKGGKGPRVGEVVWYYRGTSNPPGPDPSPEPEGQPLAAIIAHVVSDVNADPLPGEDPATENRVNICVISADGGRYARQNILLFNGVAPDEGEAFVEWPEDKDAREKAQKAVLDEKARVAADQAKLRAKAAEDADKNVQAVKIIPG